MAAAKRHFVHSSELNVKVHSGDGEVEIRPMEGMGYPEITFTLTTAQIRGLMKMLAPSENDTWQDLDDIAVYE